MNGHGMPPEAMGGMICRYPASVNTLYAENLHFYFRHPGIPPPTKPPVFPVPLSKARPPRPPKRPKQSPDKSSPS